MKKILVFLGLFILIYIGGSYFLGIKHSQNYDEIFAKNIPSQVSVENNHKNGIFKTQSISNVTIPKEYLAEIAGLDSDEVEEDLKFEITTTIIHPLFSVISGTKGEGSIKILSYQDLTNKFLKDKDLIKYSFKVKGNNNQKAIITTTEINYEDEIGEIKFSPITANIEYINGGISKIDSKQEEFKLKIKDNTFNLKMDNIQHKIVYDKPMKFEYKSLYKFVSSNTELSFKNFILNIENKKNGKLNVQFPSYEDKSKITVKNGIINVASVSNMDKLFFDIDGEKIELNDLKSNTSLNNLNEKFYDKLFEVIENNTFVDLKERDMQNLIELFIEKNPSLELKNLSFKYNDKHSITFNLKAGVNKFDLSNPMNVLGNIYLNGKTSFSKSFVNYMFKDDIDSKNMFISNEILKENGDNYDISFEYDKNQMDVILNEKIGVGQILSTIL